MNRFFLSIALAIALVSGAARAQTTALWQGPRTSGDAVWFFNSGGGVVLQDAGAPPALASGQLGNLLLNTQWKVMAGLPFSGQVNQAGSGVEAGLPFTGFTAGSNAATFAMVSTGEIKINDLVIFSGTADPVLTAQTGLVTAVVTNTSVTTVFPLGLAPGATTTGTITQKQRGDIAGGNGNGPDQWGKTTTLLLSKDDFPTNQVFNSAHQLWIKKGSASAETLSQRLDTYFAPNQTSNLFKGKTVAFGIGATNPGGPACSWRPYVNDGALHYGVAVAATAATWSEVSYTFGSTPNQITFGIEFNGPSGCIYYIANPIAVVGVSPGGSQNFMPMANETLRPIGDIVPYPYAGGGTTITYPAVVGPDGSSYGFYFRPYLDTQGAVSWDTSSMRLQIEGRCTNVGTTTTLGGALGLRSKPADPNIIFSLLLTCAVGGPLASQPGWLTYGLDATANNDAAAWLYSPIQSDVWKNVAFDIALIGMNHP
jgi:hypothetical protein